LDAEGTNGVEIFMLAGLLHKKGNIKKEKVSPRCLCMPIHQVNPISYSHHKSDQEPLLSSDNKVKLSLKGKAQEV
jgi:hypothetical protein